MIWTKLLLVALAVVLAGIAAPSLAVETRNDMARAATLRMSSVADVLAATPTMLSASSSMRAADSGFVDQTKTKRITVGNTVTIARSRITFADRQTLADTIVRMIRRSEPRTGDAGVTRAILAVLGARDDDAAMRKQIRAVIACREHEAMLRACIEALLASSADDAADTPAEMDANTEDNEEVATTTDEFRYVRRGAAVVTPRGGAVAKRTTVVARPGFRGGGVAKRTTFVARRPGGF